MVLVFKYFLGEKKINSEIKSKEKPEELRRKYLDNTLSSHFYFSETE